MRHGMLVSEYRHLDVIETLSKVKWISERQRNRAIEMYLQHLTQAIKKPN